MAWGTASDYMKNKIGQKKNKNDETISNINKEIVNEVTSTDSNVKYTSTNGTKENLNNSNNHDITNNVNNVETMNKTTNSQNFENVCNE